MLSRHSAEGLGNSSSNGFVSADHKTDASATCSACRAVRLSGSPASGTMLERKLDAGKEMLDGAEQSADRMTIGGAA